MKYFNHNCFTWLLIIVPFFVRAQGLYVSPGAHWVASGRVNVVLNDGSLVNSGDFDPGNSSVLFTGSTQKSAFIGGDSRTTFYNLVVDMRGRDVQLQNDISVTNNLAMRDGNVQLNTHTVDLGRTGYILDERNTARIAGVGKITATANLNAPHAVNPGNIGVEITSPALMGNTQIIRAHGQQRGPDGQLSIYRYFDIQPESNQHLGATLRFFYLDAELAGQDKRSLALFTSGRDNRWALSGKDRNDLQNNWIAKTGIEELHRFTAAIPVAREKMATNLVSNVNVYPNPARDQFRVSFFTPEERDALLRLYDQNGYLLEEKQVHCLAGKNTVTWNISSYAAASYQLVSPDLHLAGYKVIKQ